MLPLSTPEEGHDRQCEAHYDFASETFSDCACADRRAQKARDRDFQNMPSLRTHQLRPSRQTF